MTTCPLCGKEYTSPPALSRTDNKTQICPACGTRQALEAASVKPEVIEQIVAITDKRIKKRKGTKSSRVCGTNRISQESGI